MGNDLYVYNHAGGHAGHQLQVDESLTGVLDRLLSLDLALVHFDTQLFAHGFSNLVVGDGTVDFAVFAAAHAQLNDLALKIARKLFSLSTLYVLAVLVCAAGTLDGIERLCGRFAGQLVGQEVVARLAVRNFKNLILFTRSLDVLKQNNLHMYTLRSR